MVETLGETEELLVSNEDIETELMPSPPGTSRPSRKFVTTTSENGLGQQLAIEILEKKVRRFLRENADIQDPS